MNNVILKDDKIIGYVTDVLDYLRDHLIDVLQHEKYEELDSNICILMRELYEAFDGELVYIKYDYDGDYTIEVLKEE